MDEILAQFGILAPEQVVCPDHEHALYKWEGVITDLSLELGVALHTWS